MEETHLFLYCCSGEGDELLIDKYENHVTFDINTSEESDIVNLSRRDVEKLVEHLSKWLND